MYSLTSAVAFVVSVMVIVSFAGLTVGYAGSAFTWPGTASAFIQAAFLGTLFSIVSTAALHFFLKRQSKLGPVPLIAACASLLLLGLFACTGGTLLNLPIALLGNLAGNVFRVIPKDAPLPTGFRGAIPPLTHIVAKTPTGTIVITAGKGLLRSFTWDGATRTVELSPSEQYWRGLQFPPQGDFFPWLGLHRTAERWPWNDWEPYEGFRTAVVHEYQRNFNSLHEAVSFLQQHRDNDTALAAYQGDGLSVAWSKTVYSDALYIDIVQVLIDGKKPRYLPGSDDKRIQVLNN